MTYSRRKFLQTSGLAMASAGLVAMAPAPIFNRGKKLAPSDQIHVALIGCRGMGFFDLKNLLEVDGIRCIGLCDVDSEVLDSRRKELEALTSEKHTTYKDYRKLLENKDLDAVVIATPDHWHCLPFVHACQEGKDIYVEKPMANSIAECALMRDATRKYNRIVQVGQQQRSGKHWAEVVEYVQSGKLGNINRVKVWANFNYGKGQPRVSDSPAPKTLDWNTYLGPAPDQPYNASRAHGGWRHQWDFGGGLMTDWGVHLLDIVLWAMKVEGPPESVAAAGGIFTHMNQAIETPDTLDVIYDMGNFTLSWEHNGGIQRGPYDRFYGITFMGENGTLVVNRNGWEIYPEAREGKYLIEAVPLQGGQNSNHRDHAANFIDSLRQRKDPVCTVEDGYVAALYAHLGNIAYRSGTQLHWDEEKQNFGKNKTANAYLKPDYRKPWVWPVI